MKSVLADVPPGRRVVTHHPRNAHENDCEEGRGRDAQIGEPLFRLEVFDDRADLKANQDEGEHVEHEYGGLPHGIGWHAQTRRDDEVRIGALSLEAPGRVDRMDNGETKAAARLKYARNFSHRCVHLVDIMKRHEGNGQIRAGILEGQCCGLGQPEIHGGVEVAGGSDKGGRGIHTDDSMSEFLQVPGEPSFPAANGGDTQFVNMHEVHDALPEAMKRRIDGRMARHVYQSRFSERKLPQLAGERRKTVGAASVLHPLVRTHPVSGRKAIYINPIRIEEIVGMESTEALPLLDELLAHSTRSCFEYRHQWKVGDVVMWDNRCLLHKANGDYPVSEVRYLYRLMLIGEKPA
jgi:hypothetical protein